MCTTTCKAKPEEKKLRYRKILICECKTVEHMESLASVPQSKEEAEKVAVLYVHNPDLETDDPAALEKMVPIADTYNDEDIAAFARELGIKATEDES